MNPAQMQFNRQVSQFNTPGPRFNRSIQSVPVQKPYIYYILIIIAAIVLLIILIIIFKKIRSKNTATKYIPVLPPVVSSPVVSPPVVAPPVVAPSVVSPAPIINNEDGGPFMVLSTSLQIIQDNLGSAFPFYLGVSSEFKGGNPVVIMTKENTTKWKLTPDLKLMNENGKCVGKYEESTVINIGGGLSSYQKTPYLVLLNRDDPNVINWTFVDHILMTALPGVDGKYQCLGAVGTRTHATVLLGTDYCGGELGVRWTFS